MRKIDGPQVTIRLPADAKRFVETEADANYTSQNSVIIRCILDAMKAKSREDSQAA